MQASPMTDAETGKSDIADFYGCFVIMNAAINLVVSKHSRHTREFFPS